MFDRAFSQKSSMKKVMGHVKKITDCHRIWNYVVLHANNPKATDWYAEKMLILTGKEPVSVVNISPVIGANAGVGAASVALLYE